jgi:hypothetical protein
MLRAVTTSRWTVANETENTAKVQAEQNGTSKCTLKVKNNGIFTQWALW